jgi:sugar lactone lactonase YvrE
LEFSLHRSISLILLAVTSALLAGCGVVASQLATPPLTTGQALQGKLHGGQQPVAGAHVYLLAANTTGYGAPSVSLLNPTQPGIATDATGSYVTTDASGGFNITGDYTCTAGQQVYLLATGGNPGLPYGTNNPALALMSVLGACPDGATFASTVPFIYINEVSTIASVYALSGFMTDATHVSSPATPAARRGLANAFLAVNNLVNIASGTALTENQQGNGVIPQAKINTLANLLAPCINSTGATTTCSTLFANTQTASGSTPTDTVAAALNIAHTPAANITPLYNLISATPPFQPTLATAPNDWTLGLTFYADNMVGPYFPAIDSIGNLWVPGYTSNTLTEFDPTGNLLSGQAGFSGGGLNLPFSVAIDSSDNLWVDNFAPLGASTISKFNNNGAAVTASPYTCAATCFFIAIDTAQNLLISGTSHTIVLNSSAAPVAQLPTTAYDSGIAIDSTGHAWTIGQGRKLYQLTLPSTVTPHAESVTATSGNELTPVAIDSADNIWFVSNKNNAIGKSDKTGTPISPSGGYKGGGLKGPAGIAIDGSNRVWVANRDGNSISAFTNSGTAISPTTGYQADGISGPRGLAIDASGNVWVTNFTYNSVTEFLGAATPAITPISPTTHGQRP